MDNKDVIDFRREYRENFRDMLKKQDEIIGSLHLLESDLKEKIHKLDSVQRTHTSYFKIIGGIFLVLLPTVVSNCTLDNPQSITSIFLNGLVAEKK